MQPTPTPILLVDDHALFRKGLSLVMQQIPSHAWEIREAQTVQDAVQKIQNGFTPDLILLDIHLPDISGLTGLTHLRRASPTSRIAMISALSGKLAVMQALDMGADGFISKNSQADEIQANVQALLAGERYFAGFEETSLRATHSTDKPPQLTARQVDILRLMDEGNTNKGIARKLGLAENTVRVHVSALMEIFDCTTRTQAIFLARQKGFLP